MAVETTHKRVGETRLPGVPRVQAGDAVEQGEEGEEGKGGGKRECCLLVLNLVSSTLPCIRQPRPRFRVLDICGFVSVCTQAFIGF
jgi:hypothetical protein